MFLTSRFDYIGKMETLQVDLPFLMEKINKENASTLLTIRSNKNKKVNIDCLYKSVSQETIDQIVKTYRNDFMMFGYDMNQYSNISNIKCH